MLILGTPGLDYMGMHRYRSDTQRSTAIDELGPTLGPVAIGLADLNRKIRRPIIERIGDVQRVFRIRQSWHLYRNGPSKVRRMEIQVDGVPVFRSGDPDLDWQAGTLRNRRVRPVAESTTSKRKGRNRDGLYRHLLALARADFPAATHVDFRSLVGPFPGKKLSLHHRAWAEAPGWEIRFEDQPGGPP